MEFGIVQGRLTKSPPGELQWFPGPKWVEEFDLASGIDISFIEVIAEREENSSNPLWSIKGREEIKRLSEASDIKLYSTCTDFIINHGLLGSDAVPTMKNVFKFLDATSKLSCKYSVFPFLEESNIDSDNFKDYINPIREIANHAQGLGITILLETLLIAKDLKLILESVDRENVACVFDTGNRAVQREDVGSEILLLNSWIKHVHIKDKNREGENVLLGTGLVNFSDIFSSLKKINYSGPYVFETTRGKDPIETAKFHMQLCKFFESEARR